MLRQIARALLPQGLYGELRRRWANWQYRRQRSRPKLSEAAFREILVDTLGIRQGSVLFVHSSADNMHLGFSAFRAVTILQEVIGKEGTVLFPCTHILGRAEEYLARGEVFDVGKSVTVMGIIPELARRQEGAIRSLHPTNSVVALGKYARELTETHPDSIYPCGEKSPFYKIVHYDGLIVGLGVSTANLSFMHCIEDIWQDRFPIKTRTNEVFSGKVIDWDGQERTVRTLAAHERIAWRNVPRYIQRHVPKTVCRDFKVNGVNYFIAHAKELYAAMEKLTSQGITIYQAKARRS